MVLRQKYFHILGNFFHLELFLHSELDFDSIQNKRALSCRGGTEPEFSKLNRARAFSSRARAELRAHISNIFRARAELRAQIFRAEPEPSFRASKMEIVFNIWNNF